MTGQKFIEGAVEGGWFPKDCDADHWSASHYGLNLTWHRGDGEIGTEDFVPIEMILLDPEAWKAVGKVEGWAGEVFGHCGRDPEEVQENADGSASCCWFGLQSCEWYVKGYQWRMYRMIDALAEGKTIEQYLETL